MSFLIGRRVPIQPERASECSSGEPGSGLEGNRVRQKDDRGRQHQRRPVGDGVLLQGNSFKGPIRVRLFVALTVVSEKRMVPIFCPF